MLHLTKLSDIIAPSRDLTRVLVPTMGALHHGHCSLITQAREIAGENGEVIVSIFVNPTQFDRKEDLDNYPSTLENDLKLCEKYGADIVFQPTAQEMYLENRSISIDETSLSAYLCGATRPGHFSGVCLVLTKFFNITRATHAIFGKKDFQQLSVVKRLVRDLNIPISIVGGETIREDSGLAMSSRNLRLSEEHKMHAHQIYTALELAKNTFQQGERSTKQLLNLVKNHLAQAPVEITIDYLELVDHEDLLPQATAKADCSIAIAAFMGDVRLIDHIELL